MNKSDFIFMKNYLKTIASGLVVFAIAVSIVLAPTTSTFAFGEFELDFGPDFDKQLSAQSTNITQNSQVESSSQVSTFCTITASRSIVNYGGSFTINWNTGGFNNITINGAPVSGNSGSMLIDNFYTKTTFELRATDGKGSSCTQRVIVDCEPPVQTYCELEVTKSVNRASASVGDLLTYTINVKNVGTADCTGDGVMIADQLDPNLTYISNTISSNLTAGYGFYPVYNDANKTLYFNGHTLTPGEVGTINWVGKVKTPSTCGDFEVKNQAKATAKELNNFQTWEYSQTVKTNIDNDCPVPNQPECTLTPATQTVGYGGKATLNWTTKNAHTVSITELGAVSLNGSSLTQALTSDKNYTLTAIGNDGQVTCAATVNVVDPAPSCDLFTATPGTITVGSKATLNWNSTNATKAFINNGIGIVPVDGSIEVSPLVSVTYKLTLTSAGNKTVDCEAPVIVSADPVPVCEFFTATPNSLAHGGGNVTLNWKVLRANSVNITPSVGTVGLIGTTSVSVTSDTTFRLTAIDSNNDQVSCTAPVTVSGPKPPLTCKDNVNFTADDTSISRGDDVLLTWSTVGVDSLSINVINETSLSGDKIVSPTSDTTYTLTAKRGNETVSCPVSVKVSSGGGGGGGSTLPRCDLDISDKKIKLGEEITLTWETSRATEVILKDDRGRVLFTTEDYRSSEKKDYYDGSIKLKPTRDTKYTLIAERGSRDRECSEEVKVESLVVLESRDQQPLVAGISLSQVPYTGFEAGPMLTIMFYSLLIAWSLYITYLVVARKKIVNSGDAFAIDAVEMISKNENSMRNSETIRPDVFVKAVVEARPSTSITPDNLPTGAPVVGYHNYAEAVNPHQASEDVVLELENRAHAQKALLSSDAVRHFISTTSGEVERNEALDEVIVEAKKNYPLEDGWIVINESRMKNLCVTCEANWDKTQKGASFVPATIPEGTGSLAEAIVTGNIVAAYDMIGSRPMFSLADAAADLDALYRHRKGEVSKVSNLLVAETTDLSEGKIKNMITALTGALDGTYTDEASAVKMAIMKAVKEVA